MCVSGLFWGVAEKQALAFPKPIQRDVRITMQEALHFEDVPENFHVGNRYEIDYECLVGMKRFMHIRGPMVH